MSEVIRAKRLPVHRGPAAWSAILGPQPAPRVLEENATYDIVIVGAGFAGLSAARRLIQLDDRLRVAVLDAGRVAEGAAGRNSGFMIDLPHELSSSDYAGEGESTDKKLTQLNRRAIAFAKGAVEEYAIQCDFLDQMGKVNGAASADGHAHNASYAKHLDALGEPYEMLDGQDMKDLTGSGYYRSGLFTPGTAILQPAGYVRGLAEGLSKQVDIFENTPVLEFKKGAAKEWLVQTPAARISAQKIILANNGHLESFGYKPGRLMHIFLFAMMTREMSMSEMEQLGGQPRWGVTPSDPMGTTMRRIDTGQGGNRIITRTCANFLPDMEASGGHLARARRVMQDKFHARFPMLNGMEMEFAWAGHLCLSRNGVSVCEEVENDVFTACCQNGLGTARGTLTGIAAAEAALGQSGEVGAFFNAQAEPDRLPPRPLSTLGANAVLRYREWKARAE